jgi:hypothetical protein
VFIKLSVRKKQFSRANWNALFNDETIEVILVNINNSNKKEKSTLFCRNCCVSPHFFCPFGWVIYMFHFLLRWSAGTFNYLTFKASVCPSHRWLFVVIKTKLNFKCNLFFEILFNLFLANAHKWYFLLRTVIVRYIIHKISIFLGFYDLWNIFLMK